MKIEISDQIKRACPELSIAILSCLVKNSASSEDLWSEIEQVVEMLKSECPVEQINKRTEIAATRRAYKLLGKDPNRYRPSAEALCRRVLRDISLYQVNTLVDLINLISIRTGYSIGGFDTEKIQGEVTLGVGEEGEEFEAIARGLLNIQGLPVYRDSIGGIGTPTSDNERTKISDETHQLTMIINDYSGAGNLHLAIDYSIDLLRKHANLSEYEVEIIKAVN